VWICGRVSHVRLNGGIGDNGIIDDTGEYSELFSCESGEACIVGADDDVGSFSVAIILSEWYKGEYISK
jgi:hypothetical protein